MSRFIQGDCEQVMSGFPSNAVDFILTDPPYLVGFTDRTGRTIANDKQGGLAAAGQQRDVPGAQTQQPGSQFLRLESGGLVYAGMESGGVPRGWPRRVYQNLRIKIGVRRLPPRKCLHFGERASAVA